MAKIRSPLKRKSRRSEPVEKETGLQSLVKSLLNKSRIDYNSRAFKVKKLRNSNMYEAAIRTKQPIKGLSVGRLKHLFKKHRMEVAEGVIKTDFGLHKQLSYTMNIKFKLLKTGRKPRPTGRRKTTKEKLAAFVEE